MGSGLIFYILVKFWRLFRWLRLPLPWDERTYSERTRTLSRSKTRFDTEDYSGLPYAMRAPKPLKARGEHTVTEELTYLSGELHDWSERTISFASRYPPNSHWNALLKRRGPDGWEYVNIFDDTKTRDAVQELRDICTFLDRLCLAYWEADEEWRDWLRQAETPIRTFNLVKFIEKQTDAAKASANVEPLRIALAAISINNWTTVPSLTSMPSDELDMAGYLLNVIGASRQAGGITELVLQMAALSSDKPSRAHPISISMRQMMEHNSQFR